MLVLTSSIRIHKSMEPADSLARHPTAAASCERVLGSKYTLLTLVETARGTEDLSIFPYYGFTLSRFH